MPIGDLSAILNAMEIYGNLSVQIKSIYAKVSCRDYFGRSDVLQILGCSDRNAGKIIEHMKTKGLIFPVKGHGKGKYKFEFIEVD